MIIAHNCQQVTPSLLPLIRESELQVLKCSGERYHLPGLPDNPEHPLRLSSLAESVRRPRSPCSSVLEFPGSWLPTLHWEARVGSLGGQPGTLKLTVPTFTTSQRFHPGQKVLGKHSPMGTGGGLGGRGFTLLPYHRNDCRSFKMSPTTLTRWSLISPTHKGILGCMVKTDLCEVIGRCPKP